MTVADAIGCLEAAGARLCISEGRIEVEYPKDRRQELAPMLSILRTNRDEVVNLLRRREAQSQIADKWPADCAESAVKFGRPYARLFPLIGKKVRTPKGPGILEQVLGPRTVRVALDSNPRKMTTFEADEVLPFFTV